MRKKKICVLHAQVPFVCGGAELMVESLTEELRKRDYDAELIALPFKWYPNNVLLDSALAWRLVDLSESNGQKIDLVIATKFPTYVVNHNNKILWLMHQFREAYDLCENKSYCGLDTLSGGTEIKNKIIEIDNKVIAECREKFSISQNVSQRLKKNNGIDSIPLYHPPKHVGRYQFGEYGNYILSIGRLDVKKRVDLLIKSLKYCDPSIHAYIGGKGPELENLQKLTCCLGLQDRVKFLGFVNDEELIRLYAGAFAVYFAPVDEDYGYITLEALLSQKPVITCHGSGGVLEFVEDEKSALVSPADEKLIGNNINRLFQNKNLCRQMGEIGYQNVKNICWNDVIEKLTDSIR